MAKTIPTDKIIESLPSLVEEDLTLLSKKIAEELEKRDKELEQEIAEKQLRRDVIRNGAK